MVEQLKEMSGGRGPDACIDAVGMEGHHAHAPVHAYDAVKQAARLETDRPHALREALMACRNTFKHKQDDCVKVVLKP